VPKVSAWLGELVSVGLVTIYQVADRNFGEFTSWAKHQRIRAATSKYPSRSSAVIGGQTTPYSPVVGNRSRESEVQESGNIRRPRAAGVGALNGFDVFLTAYPRKENKAAAQKAWAKLAPDAGLQRVILAAIAAHKAGPDWPRDGGRFIPHPATWLNGKRWLDEVRSASVSDPGDPAVRIADVWKDRKGGEVRL
jgi:hypothetical protein